MNYNKTIRNSYYVLKRLSKATNFFIRELIKPISFLKGEEFENCLRKKVFVPSKYDLVMKTHDFHENKKDYVESSLHPDYLFRNKETNNEFWVEAKYRENLYKGKLEWCSKHQLIRYKKIKKENDVIIAIGYGGRPRNPEKIFLIPLDEISYTGLYLNQLSKYEFKNKRKNIIDNVKDKVYNYKK